MPRWVATARSGFWDATAGRFLAELKGQSRRGPRIATCPDPERAILASVDADGTIDVWDMRTGRKTASVRMRAPRGGEWS